MMYNLRENKFMKIKLNSKLLLNNNDGDFY